MTLENTTDVVTQGHTTCACAGGHTAACRQRKHRATRGRRPRGYVLAPEDRAAIAKVCADDPLPDRYFTGPQRITINEE